MAWDVGATLEGCTRLGSKLDAPPGASAQTRCNSCAAWVCMRSGAAFSVWTRGNGRRLVWPFVGRKPALHECSRPSAVYGEGRRRSNASLTSQGTHQTLDSSG
jgi:hypothetical protein